MEHRFSAALGACPSDARGHTVERDRNKLLLPAEGILAPARHNPPSLLHLISA